MRLAEATLRRSRGAGTNECRALHRGRSRGGSTGADRQQSLHRGGRSGCQHRGRSRQKSLHSAGAGRHRYQTPGHHQTPGHWNVAAVAVKGETQAAVAAVGKTRAPVTAAGKIGVLIQAVVIWNRAAVAAAKSVRGGLCISHVILAIGFSPHGISKRTQTLSTCWAC